MGEITKERPHGYKTETEAWNEDTKRLDFVKYKIKHKEIENYFELIFILESVKDRSCLGSTKRYSERIQECNSLKKQVKELKN